jgi:hypothetical protein
MGTISCSNWKTKKDVVNNLTSDLNRSGFNVLGQKGSVDGVWYLVEKEARKFIYFGKIEKNRGQFFLKDIPEEMGPCYYSCPVKFIQKASEPINEYSREWREKVLAYHAQASKKVELSEGMKLKLYGNDYTMTRIYKLGKGTNYIVTNEVGQRFRLKRTQLKDIEVIGE